MVETLDRDLLQLGDLLKQRAGARSLLERQAGAAERDAEAHRKQAETLNHVVALLAAAQEMWSGTFQLAVGQVVSPGLSGVFGESLELVVVMGVQADLPVARFSVKDSRGLETDIMEARGGGLVNVSSFLLQMLTLLSTRPQLRRLLILDESFSNLSIDFLPQLALLLWRMCLEGNFQMIVITQTGKEILAMTADMAYRFWLEDGMTKDRRLRGAEEAAWPNE